MMRDTVERIRKNDWRAQPWKNGGGVTHEVFRWGTASNGDFALRISVAEIDGAQPFSRFDGYERTLIALDESDLRILIDGAARPLTRYEAVRFSGEANAETQGKGCTRDLNVIAHAELRAHVDVSPLEAASRTPEMVGRRLAVFALEATSLRGDDGALIHLDAHDTLILPARSAPTSENRVHLVWIRF